MSNACSDRKKNIQWATKLKLKSTPESNKEENCHLVEIFNFESIDQYNQHDKKFIFTNGEVYKIV